MLTEVVTGLQCLVAIGVRRRPAEELLPGVARIWTRALDRHLQLDAMRDVPRIRAAFELLTASRRTWPLPADLIAALPPLEPRPVAEVRALPRPSDPGVAEHHLDASRQLLTDGARDKHARR